MTTLAETKPLLSFAAGELMSRDVVAIPMEMSVKGAAHLLAQANVSGAPVVDALGRCVGVVGATDFVHWVEGAVPPRNGRRHDEAMYAPWQIPEDKPFQEGSIDSLMTKDPVTVPPTAKIGAVAQIMLDAHIHRVIVVDPHNRPVGVVSSTDILAAVARADRARRSP